MRYLAIVPARGGSKGIKDKNILKIQNRYLIEYSITPALDLVREGIIDKLILSTDSEKIAHIGRSLGIEVPYLRPAAISGDKAKSIAYVLHAIEYFKHTGVDFDAVIILQPTCPLRDKSDIQNAISLFECGGANSLITCYCEEYINDLVIYHKKNNLAQPIHSDHNKGVRRQDLEPLYIRNGAIYITQVEYLIHYKRIIADLPLMYVMPKYKSVNLDTLDDLYFLERILPEKS